MFRQGDVLIERIDAIPTEAKEAPRDDHGRIVLAHGESTGHAHAIRAAGATAFRMETAERDALRAEVDYILVGGSGAVLTHEYVSGAQAEHNPIPLAPGAYRIIKQREYSPEAIRSVVD